MILADTDILSALAKVNRLPLLFALFKASRLHITPAVLEELAYSLSLRRSYAKEVFALISAGQLYIVMLSQAEAMFQTTLPNTLDAGERESIAVTKEREGIVLSNESRVAHYCRQYRVRCLRLPDILRGFWVERVVSRQEVQSIIEVLQTIDQMQFKQPVLDAIFADLR
jgi:predicted nucleic acid-binding protein